MLYMKAAILALAALLPPAGAARPEVKPLALDLSNYDYPFPVSHLALNIQQQELKMAYMDVASEQPNGQTVLLLHGKNFNGAYWRSTIRALAENGFRVVVPDQIGFGKSSKPEYFQYSFHQLAHNTRVLLDKLKVQKVSVLGHSMGGMLAARFALMYPDATDKLILVNPIGLEDYKLKVPYQQVDDWYKRELKLDYETIKQYQLKNYYDGKWKPAYDEWVQLLAGWTENKDYPRIAWNSALTYDMIFTQPVVYELQHIEAPTLLIIGTRDRTALGKPLVAEEVRKTMGRFEKLGHAIRDRMQDPTLVELEDVGHLPHIEAFEQFYAPLLSFLTNGEPKETKPSP